MNILFHSKEYKPHLRSINAPNTFEVKQKFKIYTHYIDIISLFWTFYYLNYDNVDKNYELLPFIIETPLET